MPFTNLQNTIVLNDHLTVESRDQNTIVFEPFQPLVVIDSIDGGFTFLGGHRGYFNVDRNRLVYSDGNVIGMVDANDHIILMNANRYAEDIYLSISYELDDGQPRRAVVMTVWALPEISIGTRKVQANWMVEGF